MSANKLAGAKAVKSVESPRAPEVGLKGEKQASTMVKDESTSLQRKGYKLYFVSPSDEKLLNELRNSGKTIGEIHSTCGTPDDKDDEIIMAVED